MLAATTRSIKKYERTYQKILEVHLGATHKRLLNGQYITDITTDKLHAEIKNWNRWHSVIGQLHIYNKIDPRPQLHTYLFGDQPTRTDLAISTLIDFNISPFDISIADFEYVEKELQLFVCITDLQKAKKNYLVMRPYDI